MTKRFVVVGSVNYDHTFCVSEFPVAHSKVRAHSCWRGPGGSAANTAYLLGRAGAAVTFVGCVGDDEYAAVALESLNSKGVDTSQVQVATGDHTGMCTVMLTATDKRMITCGGANRRLRLDQIDRGLFAQGVHLHIATGTVDGLRELTNEARSAGATISVEWNGRNLRGVIPEAEVCFMNHDELSRICGSGVDPIAFAQQLARELGGRIVVTQGVIGARDFEQGSMHSAPAVSVTPVDRTGGGDAFDAGYLFAWSRGEDAESCLRAGLKLAADIIVLRGARPQ